MGKRIAIINLVSVISLLWIIAIEYVPIKAASPEAPPTMATNLEFPVYKIDGLDSRLVQLIEGHEMGQIAKIVRQLNVDV